VEVWIHSFLTVVLDGDVVWLTLRPLYCWEYIPGTQRRRHCVASLIRRGFCERQKTSVCAGNRTSFAGPLSHSAVTMLNEIFRLPQYGSNWRKFTPCIIDAMGRGSWLRHGTSSRKVAGSIRIFHWLNPSGSTQPLTDMSTKGTSWGGKGGRWVGP
jgi:hypothetical protein